jgi:hypothetical protein
MVWWLWVLLGLALLALEITTPGGFFVLFFGVAALVVGVLLGVGLGGPLWVQLLLFSVLSVGSLLLFRGRLVAWMKSHEPAADRVDSLVGQIAIAQEDLAPGAVGRAELRGTVWTARNADVRPLARGQRCRVERVDGLSLLIRAAE